MDNSDNVREFKVQAPRPRFLLDPDIWVLVSVGAFILFNAGGDKVSSSMLSSHLPLIFVSFVFLLYRQHTQVSEESLLLIRGVGLQIRTTYKLFNRTQTQFIDRARITDILINEGITRSQVRYYLAIFVKDDGKMAVVFEHLLPRINPFLLQVYHGAREAMQITSAGSGNDYTQSVTQSVSRASSQHF